MKNVLRNIRYWFGGTLAATAGVVLARLVAPHLAPHLRLPFTLGGQLLALAGLAVLCVGVNRRVRSDADSV